MAALTDDKRIVRTPGEALGHGVALTALIYGGALLALNSSNYAEPATAAADKRFLGVAQARCDNSSGANGDKTVEYWRKGCFQFAGSGLTDADVKKLAYCVDDQTITTTPGLLCVGRIVEVISATVALVDIEQARPNRKTINLCLDVTAASTSHVIGHAVTRACRIISGRVAAQTKPDYATATLALSAHDSSADEDHNLLSTTNIDLEALAAAMEGEALTLTTTTAHLALDAGDTIKMTVAIGATEATAGKGITVTLEVEEQEG